MGIWFLDLGKQPLANGFLTPEKFDNEFFYDLKAHFDPKTYLVSLDNFVPPEKMFNENYAYISSCSQTMIKHFKDIALSLKNRLVFTNPDNLNILEIGSNDGIFIKHFNPFKSTCVEPCSNFADITLNMGYPTYKEFWSMDLSERILKERGKQDVVYSANCMCHIQNIQEAFKAVENVLSPYGMFIFEDPSMLDVIKNCSYDQFYDEHAHIFSLLALQRLLENAGLYIYRVEHLNTHGGSNRIYANKQKSHYHKVENLLDIERGYKLDKLLTYFKFGERVGESRLELKELIKYIRNRYEHIVGYGATSKSTVVYNYCQLGPDEIDFIIDTTPNKQNKYSPGTHIPIIAPKEITQEYAFLGAWNYKDEIVAKEKDRKFQFITHVPKVMVF